MSFDDAICKFVFPEPDCMRKWDTPQAKSELGTLLHPIALCGGDCGCAVDSYRYM